MYASPAAQWCTDRQPDTESPMRNTDNQTVQLDAAEKELVSALFNAANLAETCARNAGKDGELDKVYNLILMTRRLANAAIAIERGHYRSY